MDRFYDKFEERNMGNDKVLFLVLYMHIFFFILDLITYFK